MRKDSTAVEDELGDAVGVHSCDVRIESDVHELVDASRQRFGGLDVVFANAGIGGFSPIVDTDVTEWMRVIEINLLGPLLAIKHAAPHMPRVDRSSSPQA